MLGPSSTGGGLRAAEPQPPLWSAADRSPLSFFWGFRLLKRLEPIRIRSARKERKRRAVRRTPKRRPEAPPYPRGILASREDSRGYRRSAARASPMGSENTGST